MQILPLLDLITFRKLQFMQRFSQIFLPTSFYDNWVLNAIGNIGDNDIQLRNADQLQIVHSNLTILFPKNLAELPRWTAKNHTQKNWVRY